MKKSVYSALIGAVSAQELRQTITFDPTLSCTKCIRGGYNYVYKSITEGSELDIVRDIQDTEDYDGSCTLKNFDGTYTDGTSEVDLTAEITSDDYSSMVVALASCPAKFIHCGQKEYVLTDSSAAPVTLAVADLDNEVDSCHWVVTADCDVPEIEVSEDYSGTSDNFSVLVLEWSQDSTSASALTFVDDRYLPVDAMPEFIEDAHFYPPATLPDVIVTDAVDSSISVVFGYLVEEDISAKLDEYDSYAEDVADYLILKDIWDDAVDSLESYYDKIDAEQDAGEMPVLPAKPVKPTLPDAYTGPELSDFEFTAGYGEITSMFVQTHLLDSANRLNLFSRKYFGLYGQGLKEDEGLGFDVNLDVEGVAGSVKTCSKRYFSINLMPEADTDFKLNSDIVHVQAFANAPRDLDTPEEPTPPSSPSADPTREEGAKYLAATAAAVASLAAFTLY